MSFRFLLLAAASPLCFAAGVARAETAISMTVTSPIATATAASGARDDIRITSTGVVKPTGGTAITLNSNNSVNIEGQVSITDANNATGLAIVGGNTGEVKVSGGITIDESVEAKDTDNDGDIDGPFATGSGHYGIRLTGTQPFHGSITRTAGAIAIEGNDSAGISLEAALEGALRSAGPISVTGDRSFGIHAAGAVGGEVNLTGAINVLGKDSIGVALDDNVGGRLVLGHSVTATGYRYTARPADAAVAKLDADDLLQGGPAVRIRGDVAGGILIDAPPADLDPKDPDEDKDGVPDAQETTGTLTVYGAAPALLVGSDTRAVHLGVVGTGTDAYGLVVKGVVQSSGVYDGISSTGMQLGGLGGAVNIDTGVRVTGSITASAVKADATALRLGAGASVPALVNAGTIKAGASAVDAVNVRAVRIDAGASVTSLDNTGTIAAVIGGAKGSATAVLDAAGSLRSITNTNQIGATITPATAGAAVTGRAIALDLRANTAGVTVRQQANTVSTITPALVGDVLFGSGAARLELLAGTLDGAVAFGSGADALKIDNGAKLTGALTDAGGGLAVDIVKGRLTATNAQTVSLSTLNLGAAGELIMTLDPAAGTATRFDVSGVANLASGAKVGLRFATKLTAPASFTLIKAGTLTSGGLDQSLLGSTPWLYKSALRVDTAQNAVIAAVRRRTAAEAGLTKAEASAYEAVFANFDRDTAVRDALLAKTDEAGFASLYDQFLPDHSGALFQVMAQAAGAAGRALDGGPGLLPNDRPRAWTQEIAFIVKRDAGRGSSYDATGFGVASGLESAATDWGVLGVQSNFVTVDVDEKAAAGAESLDGSVVSAGLYWRAEGGGLSAALGATGGYAWMKSGRAVVDQAAGLSRTAKSEWNGMTVAAHGSLAWRLGGERFYARPQVTADYFLFKEDGRKESGGGSAIDLQIEDRSSSELDAFAGVTLGMQWGEESALIWTPEVTLGWRQVAGDGAGVTTARFVAGGPAFQVAAPDLESGGGVVRLALRGQGWYFDVGVEAGAESRDGFEAYDARLVARLTF
jgi:hypothetical protein